MEKLSGKLQRKSLFELSKNLCKKTSLFADFFVHLISRYLKNYPYFQWITSSGGGCFDICLLKFSVRKLILITTSTGAVNDLFLKIALNLPLKNIKLLFSGRAIRYPTIFAHFFKFKLYFDVSPSK